MVRRPYGLVMRKNWLDQFLVQEHNWLQTLMALCDINKAAVALANKKLAVLMGDGCLRIRYLS